MIEDAERNRICEEVKPEDRSPEFPSRIIRAKVPPENFTFYASSSCGNYPLKCEDDGIKFKITKPPRTHEEFEPCNLINDLALVELDQDIRSTLGSPICMIEKEEHLAEELTGIGYGRDHLSTYNITTISRYKQECNKLEEVIRRILRPKLEKHTLARLLPKYTCIPTYYQLVKTHKLEFSEEGEVMSDNDIKTRPIVSSCGGPTDAISWFLQHMLSPLLNHVPAHLKNVDPF
ncbi:hypothetical protein OSTOST_16992 [Ostertagia ostertagi]